MLSHFSAIGQESSYKVRLANTEIPSEKVLKLINNINGDSLLILNQLESVIIEIYSEGYLAASIDSIWFDSTYAYIDLYLGKKYLWSELNFSKLDNEALESLRFINKRKKVEHVDLHQLQNIKNNIVSYYENNGYPFASVNLDPFEINDSLFKASIEVNKGGFYVLDSVIMKGDAKISSNYINKTLNVESRKPFNQQKINEISKKIADLSFISEIKPAEIEFREDAVDLYLYLANKKANMFNGIIGFLPDPEGFRDEQTGKLLITGELNLNLVNPFGRGEEILLRWEKLESSTQKLNVGFNYPYIFKTNLGIDADFELYKKDSTYLSLNTGLGLRLFLSNDDYIKGYYRYKSSSRIGGDESLSSLNFADVKSNIFGMAYYLNDLDYKFNPRKGTELNLFGGAGFKTIIDASNEMDSLEFEADKNTLEIEAGLDFNLYFPIYRNFVFHFGNSTRYLDQFADSEKEPVFFENELYRFGGANSLRGFDESIFFASVYSIQNIEIKYLFEQNSAFYVFWNGAYYYKELTSDTTEDFPWGFGIGMDFETKAGIFSLSYALGKQFDNPFEIQAAKIHFGYVSRF